MRQLARDTLPSKTRRYLGEIIRGLEHQGPEDWVFAGKTRQEPVAVHVFVACFE